MLSETTASPSNLSGTDPATQILEERSMTRKHIAKRTLLGGTIATAIGPSRQK
jgi:hypothetical protein